MVKQQKKKKLSNISNIPKPWIIAGAVSLAFNALLIVVCIVGAVCYSYGVFDYAIVNTGINMMCSSRFRNDVEDTNKNGGYSDNHQRLILANVDYICGNNGGQKYFEQGFNSYVHSLGIKTE